MSLQAARRYRSIAARPALSSKWVVLRFCERIIILLNVILTGPVTFPRDVAVARRYSGTI